MFYVAVWEHTYELSSELACMYIHYFLGELRCGITTTSAQTTFLDR